MALLAEILDVACCGTCQNGDNIQVDTANGIEVCVKCGEVCRNVWLDDRGGYFDEKKDKNLSRLESIRFVGDTEVLETFLSTDGRRCKGNLRNEFHKTQAAFRLHYFNTLRQGLAWLQRRKEELADYALPDPALRLPLDVNCLRAFGYWWQKYVEACKRQNIRIYEVPIKATAVLFDAAVHAGWGMTYAEAVYLSGASRDKVKSAIRLARKCLPEMRTSHYAAVKAFVQRYCQVLAVPPQLDAFIDAARQTYEITDRLQRSDVKKLPSNVALACIVVGSNKLFTQRQVCQKAGLKTANGVGNSVKFLKAAQSGSRKRKTMAT